MKDKAIFLDRDGTLIRDTGYLHKTKDIVFLPTVIDGLKKLGGYRLFIVTNQSGIARKRFLIEDMHKANDHILSELKKEKIIIEHIYYCPHLPEDDCDCRKPRKKHINSAEKEFNLDIMRSFVIGDKPADIGLAKNAGCKSIYLLTGHGLELLEDARKLGPDYVCADFSRVADFILFEPNHKLLDNKALFEIATKLKKAKKKIVTLNGTFDILHKGHDYMISEAKKQGDVLIVGVNSDSSVKSNKGDKRPINNELARARMVASHNEVDYVVIFQETTPISLLETIKPDIHVNGSEYGENCIEAPTVKKFGGKIYIVNRIPGVSSTKILEGKL